MIFHPFLVLAPLLYILFWYIIGIYSIIFSHIKIIRSSQSYIYLYNRVLIRSIDITQCHYLIIYKRATNALCNICKGILIHHSCH